MFVLQLRRIDDSWWLNQYSRQFDKIRRSQQSLMDVYGDTLNKRTRLVRKLNRTHVAFHEPEIARLSNLSELPW